MKHYCILIEFIKNRLEASSPSGDPNLRGPLTVMNLEYGKLEKGSMADLKLKLVMIMIDQLVDNKVQVKNKDKDDYYNMQKERKYF